MKAYKVHAGKKKVWRKVVIGLCLVVALVGAGVLVVIHRVYTNNLRPVNVSAQKEVVVSIPTGSSLNQIALLLKNSGVIRADWAFKQYVLSEELGDKLQAGTYRLNTSQDVKSIVTSLTEGKVAVDLFTILPGQRLDQIKKAFIEGGFAADAVEKAFNPNNYIGHPALVDKPVGASLEGYLYPDSFQKTATTLPETIIRASLTEMSESLTADLRAAFTAQNLTAHQAITLASVVEREVAGQDDRATAAQVFLTRIKKGMRLQSDVTVIYGMALAGKNTEYVDTGFDSPYNTFLHDGLPVGPISNVTSSGLKAVAHPSNTDYLYFVAGDGDEYGKTFFSRTLQEHQSAVAAHCKSCSQQ